MSATDPVQAVAEVLNSEGCLPGHSIHSWRCEDRERYPEPCTCVEELAAEVIAAARPLIEREAKDALTARLAAVEAALTHAEQLPDAGNLYHDVPYRDGVEHTVTRLRAALATQEVDQ